MSNLFKKAAVFTDIHFGLKSNSQTHKDDCLNFIKWFIVKAKEEGMVTLKQDGYLKVLSGETTMEEGLRVAQE